MAHLEEFTTYKQTLMQAICTNDAIVELMKLEGDPDGITGRDMRYKRIFPYNYVPLTTEKATTFICFSVVAPNVKSGVISTLKLIVWVFTHQNLMKTKNGMRTDLLVSEIDKMLNGSIEYGLGRVELQSCNLMQVPSEGYTGLCSVYTVDEYNRGCTVR